MDSNDNKELQKMHVKKISQFMVNNKYMYIIWLLKTNFNFIVEVKQGRKLASGQ